MQRVSDILSVINWGAESDYKPACFPGKQAPQGTAEGGYLSLPGRNENGWRDSSAGRVPCIIWLRGRCFYFEACTVGATMATIKACLSSLVKGLYWIRKAEPQKI